MSNLTPTSMSFERRYADDSGVEFAVRLGHDSSGRNIGFEHIHAVEFPVDELDWLIACLLKIKQEFVP